MSLIKCLQASEECPLITLEPIRIHLETHLELLRSGCVNKVALFLKGYRHPVLEPDFILYALVNHRNKMPEICI